jgi:MFS superfamily sulfate permease-like transporter
MKKYLSDLKSSIVVALVALPLCLGIALASNAPLYSGLIAGIIGGIIVGILSGSPLSVSGPAAGLAVIVATSIHELGAFDVFLVSTFLAGGLQIIFALLKGSVISYLFPSSVIRGMLTSIGLILILKQFTHLLGLDKDAFSYHEITLLFTGQMLNELLSSLHGGVMILSASSIFLYYSWTWLGKKYPNFLFEYLSAPLLVVLYGLFMNNILYSENFKIAGEHLLNLNLSGGFASLQEMLKFPQWDAIWRREVWHVAATLAIIATLESLLSVDAADKLSQHRMTSQRNKELLAQGGGNILSGLLGGLPLTAVIVRTSANIHSGAQTRLSTILHGLWLVVFIVFIPTYLSLIPLASLSVILLTTGLKLASLDIFKKEIEKGWERAVPFFTTILCVFLFDLLVGIFMGLLVGLSWQIYRFNKSTVSLTQDQNLYLLKFEKDTTFLAKPKLSSLFSRIPRDSQVTISCADGISIDDDIIEVIEQFMEKSKSLGIDVSIKKSNLSNMNIFRGA